MKVGSKVRIVKGPNCLLNEVGTVKNKITASNGQILELDVDGMSFYTDVNNVVEAR